MGGSGALSFVENRFLFLLGILFRVNQRKASQPLCDSTSDKPHSDLCLLAVLWAPVLCVRSPHLLQHWENKWCLQGCEFCSHSQDFRHLSETICGSTLPIKSLVHGSRKIASGTKCYHKTGVRVVTNFFPADLYISNYNFN